MTRQLRYLEQLLDVIAPFDPERDVGGSAIDGSRPNPTTSTEKSDLYHMERAAGRQQFHNIIDPVSGFTR